MDEIQQTPAAEAQAQGDARPEMDFARLDALGIALVKSRKEAIDARVASHIEDIWLEDEEHYEGIDDAARADQAWQTRPVGQVMDTEKPTQSTVFLNITRPYCDAAAAKMSDMLQPTDDRAWEIKPTPIPDLISVSKGQHPQAMVRAAASQYPGNPAMAKAELQKATQLALQAIEEASAKAKKAQTQIEDWHIESQYHAETRKMIEDTARLGTGILKGPTPEKKRTVAVTRIGGVAMQGQQPAQGGIGLVIEEKIIPGSKAISPWNLYPDPACGENIHDGSFIWERDYLTPKMLADLKGSPGYIEQQINACLEEGPKKAASDAPARKEPDGTTKDYSKMFEVWYYHGVLQRDELEALLVDTQDFPQDRYVAVPAVVTMVNSRVVKVHLNPLDSGEFPYDVMVWQRRAGKWFGIGVSRQMRDPQRVLVGAVRMLMDNSGRGAGPMWGFDDEAVEPIDGIPEIRPWKGWRAKNGANMQQAFAFFKVEMMITELMVLIQAALKWAEDATGLPLLLQGQQGAAPDTVGGMTMLNNNGSTVLRRIARAYDDNVTEPKIRKYYRYLLQYSKDDSAKGDFQIDARGSSALVERALQAQELPQLLQASLNPAFGIDPKKVMAEMLKARHLDVKRFEYDDPQWQQIMQKMALGLTNPKLVVEQVKEQFAAKMQQLENAFKAQENDKDRQLKLVLERIQERIMGIKAQGEADLTMQQIKADFAQAMMEVNARKDIAEASLTLDAHKHVTPSAQPHPRGPEGSGEAQPAPGPQ